MKKILITSGGTREYIDDVRVLTNISSGKLGAEIASKFLESARHSITSKIPVGNEYEVHYVYAHGAEMPFLVDDDRTTNWYTENAKYLTSFDGVFVDGKPSYKPLFNYNPLHLHKVTDVASLMKVMEELVPQMDIIIHSMAVSDFGFKPIDTKLKSSDPEAFIESMRERIYKNPKVLSHIKDWNPSCFLVSFKFEVGLEHEELIKIAHKSMIANHCDVVVANDKKEMVDNKNHIAYLLEDAENLSAGEYTHLNGSFYKETKVEGKTNIAELLFNIINI